MASVGEHEPLLGGHTTMNGDLKSSENTADESNKRRIPFTKRQILTFFSLGFTTTLQNASFAILTPFFPIEAAEKSASQGEIGFIFGVYALVQFIISPILGKVLPRVGGKFMFIAGLWISAGCNVLFGTLDLLQPGRQFVNFCFALRIVGAIGSAACGTATFALIANSFPNNIAQMIAWMETFSGIGVMVGPFIGGVFYQIGGFKMPFFILGGVCLVCVPLNVFVLPSQHGVSREMGSLRKLIQIPSVWPICYAIMMVPAGLGFFDATMALHLQQFDVTPLTIGLMFLLTGGVYALFSPLWGYLADKQIYTRLMIELGFILMAASYLLVGPSPLLHIESSLENIWFALVVLGLGLGNGLIPTFQDIMMSARKRGMPDTMATHSVTSGLFNSMFNLGNFLGPTVGGIMVQAIGFPWSVTVIAGCSVLATIIILIMDMCEKRCGWPWACSSAESPGLLPPVGREDYGTYKPRSPGVQEVM